MKVVISKSDRPEKRYKAVFSDDSKKVKTVHFGLKGGSTYIDHGNDKKKDAYIARHRVNENFNDPMTAGSLSYHILWNKKTLSASIADFKKRFNLS